MSLDYNTSSIENANRVCFEEINEEIRMRQVTRQMIFFTERVGLPVITKDNYVTFWRRVNFWERVNGAAMFFNGDEDKPISRFVTLKEVHDHVGLRTNARRITDSKFEDEIFKRLACDVNELLVNEQRQCETLPTSKATQPVP